MPSLTGRYVAIVHVTRVGSIEHVNLCDNSTLETDLLWRDAPLPKWFVNRVALLRFCPVGDFVDTMKGRKYTDYMILLYLTPTRYKQLFKFRMD
jgi:hypothetical protein